MEGVKEGGREGGWEERGWEESFKGKRKMLV